MKIILIIVSILVASFAIMKFFIGFPNPQETPQPQAAISSSPTPSPVLENKMFDGWKTYSDPDKIFTIRYPSTWYNNECGGGYFNTTPINDCGSSRIFPVEVYLKRGVTLETAVDSYKEEFKVSQKTIQVKGQDVVQVSLVNKTDVAIGPGWMKYRLITLFPYNQGLVAVETDRVNESSPDYTDIYNQIVSSFELLPKVNK